MGQSLLKLNRSGAGPHCPHRACPGLLYGPGPGPLLFGTAKFPDISQLPPELALAVLSNLNATDLCLAACVSPHWSLFANDELLWEGLCRTTWGSVSAYRRRSNHNFSFKQLYMLLDEGTLTFNADALLGMEYLIANGVLEDDCRQIADFINSTNRLDRRQVRLFLDTRRDVLEEVINLHNYADQFLPNALRAFFSNIETPNQRGHYLQTLIDKFAERFICCNPGLGLTIDTISILCYSLLLLSIDLTSPHVKNKMSKREFIRNIRHATTGVDDDLLGHLYDNIYLVGHIAPQKW